MIEWLETRLAPAAGTISGMLWNDLNANGTQESGEPALAGRTVYLDQNRDGVLDNGETSTTTNANGAYSFTGLAAGTYYVAEALPAGWQQTSPASASEQTVTLTDATTHVFTFNNLATPTDSTIGPYQEAGFTFNTTVPNQPTDVFRIYGSTDTVRYAGAPALTSEWSPVTISLTQNNGGAFTLNSIDLSTIWNSVYYPTVTFTGTRADGSTVTQAFSLSNQLGFQTETFNGFTNVVSVTWKNTGFSDYHQFRNVSVTLPGTTSASGINFGSVLSNVPKAVADSFTTSENTTLNVAAPGILANDSDPNGLTLTPVVTSTTTHGKLTVNADGSLSYVPNTYFTGTDSFNYYVTDGQASSTYVTDTITVTPVNQPPVAVNDSYTVAENSSLTTGAGQTFLTMSSQAGDWVGQGKNYYFTPSSSSFSAPTLPQGASYTNTVNIDITGPGSENWQLDFQAPNRARLTPGVYNGAMRWPFEAANQPGFDISGDGRGNNTETGTFTVLQALYDANGNVIAFAATFTQYGENSTAALSGEIAYHSSLNQPEGVLFNDSDPDGDSLTAQLVTAPSHGSVVLNSDGSFKYTPVTGYSGPDSFTYQASDGQLTSNVATVNLTVEPLPTVVNQAYAATENQTLTVGAAAGLLTGSSDPNSLPLSSSLVANPAHGSVVVNADGSFTYTPASGFYGSDSFTYDATDGQVTSALATVTLTVNAPPVASNVTYSVRENGTLNIAGPGVLSGASDPDGDAVSAVLVNGPASGTLVVNADGSFVYTPAAGFSGTDSFTFEASDGTLDSSVATATIQVLPLQATSTYLGWEGPNPVEYGLPFTLLGTVTVNSPGTGTPTGTVTFLDGTTPLGTVTLDANGFAKLPLSTLAVGSHAFSVQYNGDANNATSNSGTTGTSSVETVIADPTMMSLASSPSRALVGQPLTLTSSVVNEVNGAMIPTGTVTFLDGTTVLGTAPLDANGNASFTTSSLALGTHAFTAVYSGDTTDQTSTSGTVSQTVYLDGTNTALVSSGTPSVVGQSVAFTATVSAATPATGTPTGTVTFNDGSVVLGTAPLVGGSATLTTSALSLGSHSITATYGGDAVHGGSSSSTVTQSVGTDTTSTSLVSSGSPSLAGQAVTFTANVTVNTPGAGTPTGTVTFVDLGTVLGSAPLVGGSVSFTTSALSVGGHIITAIYNGDTNDQGSQSSAVGQTVNLNATTATVTSSLAAPIVGQPVTFTVTVGLSAPWSGAATPTGTVYFDDGASQFGTATLDASGTATFTTSRLGVGSHSISVIYGGDSLNQSTTSNTLTQSVGQDSTTTTLSASPNPSIFTQSVTLTAFVSAQAPGASTPSGTVTFWLGGKALGTQGVDITGHASLTFSTLPPGTDAITAVYSGDPNEVGSTSAPYSQVVNPQPTTTALTTSASTSVLGQAVTFTAQVSAVAPYFGLATGTVTFYDGSTAIGTTTLNGGYGTLTTAALGVGTHSITAVYGGDTGSVASTSAPVTQTVHPDATFTTLTSSANPSVVNQSVTFTANVAVVAPGTVTPTGTITFKDGSTVLATVPLVDGTATLTRSNLGQGTHSITAVYSGNALDQASTSATLTQTVQSATATALSASRTRATFGTTVTFTATIRDVSPGSGTPTGVVTFYDGTTILGTATVNKHGTATFQTSSLARGNHSIYAVYEGDGTHHGSQSSLIVVMIS